MFRPFSRGGRTFSTISVGLIRESASFLCFERSLQAGAGHRCSRGGHDRVGQESSKNRRQVAVTPLLTTKYFRYLVLVQAIVLRDISVQVKKRFPTMNHLVTAGFMTQAELDHFTEVPSKVAKYWVPAQWAFAHMRAARQMGLISSDIALVNVNEKVFLWYISLYPSRSIPTVIKCSPWHWPTGSPSLSPIHRFNSSSFQDIFQVVHLAVRTFFVMALMGRQFINPSRNLANYTQTADIYIPVMSSLQFIFIVGWVKVAEVMLNPLGEDNE